MRQGNHSSAKPSLSQPPQEKWSADDLIFENVLTDLDAIPFHHTLDELQRLAPTCFPFPVHLAVHKFVGSGTPPRPYVEPHSHGHPELNVLIGEPGALVYRFTLDNQVRDVKSPATVWIPAGVKHSANVQG